MITTVHERKYHNPLFKEDSKSKNIETTPKDAKHLSVVRIGRLHRNLQRSTEMSQKSF